MWKDDGKPERERCQEPNHEGVHMVKRQGQEQPLVGTVDPNIQESPEVREEIAMGQRYAFRSAADSRGIEQQGSILVIYGRNRVNQLTPEALPALRIRLVRVQQDDGVVSTRTDHWQAIGQRLNGDNPARGTVFEHMNEVIPRHLRVDGQGHGACIKQGHAGDDPFRSVRRVEGHRLAFSKPPLD
jgi:hypothetical protein